MISAKRACSVSGAIGVLVLLAAAAQAQTPGITLTNTTTTDSLGNPPFTLGYEFTDNDPITVTSLGVFDKDQDGLTDSYDVGLFSSDGTLLTSTTVADGTTDPLTNQFRYASTDPVTLTAGDNYFIGALYLDGNDGVLFPGDPAGFATDPSITFNDASYAFGGTLSAPANEAATDPGYLGPNFLFTSDLAAPEPAPGTVFMIAGLGLLALGLRTRMRRTSAE